MIAARLDFSHVDILKFTHDGRLASPTHAHLKYSRFVARADSSEIVLTWAVLHTVAASIPLVAAVVFRASLVRSMFEALLEFTCS